VPAVDKRLVTHFSLHFLFAARKFLLTDSAWVLALSYNLNIIIVIKQSIHRPTTTLVAVSRHE
jgi:hypothetical protein